MAESSTGVNATSCPICFEEYNREANKPLVGQCGHSLCKTCYDSTPANRRSTCPTCNQQNKFANPTINFAYLELVDQINKGPKETKKPCAECKKSAVVNRFRVCVSCGIRDGYLMHFAGKTRIAPSEESFQSNISKVDKLSFCDSCEITGGHKGHPTILVTELMKDAKDESQIYQSHNKLCKIRTAYDDELERTRVAHINLFDRAIAQLNDYPIMDPISQANMLRVFSNVEAKMQKNVDRLKRVREHMERHVKNLLQLGEPSENSDDSDNEHLTYEPYHAHIPIYRQPSPDPRPAPMANMPPAITADGIYSLNGSMIQDSVIEIPS